MKKENTASQQFAKLSFWTGLCLYVLLLLIDFVPTPGLPELIVCLLFVILILVSAGLWIKDRKYRMSTVVLLLILLVSLIHVYRFSKNNGDWTGLEYLVR